MDTSYVAVGTAMYMITDSLTCRPQEKAPPERTFQPRCPLPCELGLLHPQEQTFKVVPPFVWV